MSAGGAGAGTPGAGARAVTEAAARGVLLLALLAAAFVRTWERVLGATGWGAGSTLLMAAPVGAALTVVALMWRRRPELPIHDRQSDKIVGTVVVTVALMIQWLVLPRYVSTYVLLHLDVAAAWVFLLGGCVFLFGLRRTGHFWQAWLLLMVASPGAIRLAVAALGGEPWAQIVVVAVVVLIGPAWVLAASSLRGRGRGGGSVAAGGAPGRIRWSGPAVSPVQAWRSAPLLVLVAVALALAPLPGIAEDRLGQGPSDPLEPGGTGQSIPSGWTERDAEDFPWAPRIYGPGSTLHRQLIRADAARLDWDPLRRPRQIMVQTLTTADPAVLDTFPLEMTYDLRSARVSRPIGVDLGNGVAARYRTVVDDERLLTWSVLSFVWTRGDHAVQRVSLLTIDDHEYDAEFPRTVPGTGPTANRLISLLFRGQASVTAETTEPKDLDMLTEVGRDLVDAQLSSQ